MKYYKRILLFLIVFSLVACGRNNKKEEHELKQKNEQEQKATKNPEFQKKDAVYESREDSIKAVKESVLRKKNYKKKKQTVAKNPAMETPDTKTPPIKQEAKKIVVPSFVYIKKILNECKIGQPMTQKELQTNFNIPEEAIQLVKSVTKISNDELDVKWKSTWLVEKMSGAKFNDGRLKVRFDKNKMYTSGGAIGIKYEKKMHTNLVLIGRSAYIPTVKGYYWQIGRD